MNMISILKKRTKRRVDLYNGPVEYRDLAPNQLEKAEKKGKATDSELIVWIKQKRCPIT